MKIEDLMFRAQMLARQEAIDNGEPLPEPEPMTFNTVQELLQKGEALSPAEAELLDNLLAHVEQPRADLGDQDAALISVEAVELLKVELQNRRAAGAEGAVPEQEMRAYAPGPPAPENPEGASVPLHGTILGQTLVDPDDDKGAK